MAISTCYVGANARPKSSGDPQVPEWSFSVSAPRLWCCRRVLKVLRHGFRFSGDGASGAQSGSKVSVFVWYAAWLFLTMIEL